MTQIPWQCLNDNSDLVVRQGCTKFGKIFGKPKVRTWFGDTRARFESLSLQDQTELLIQAVEAFTPFWQRAIQVCADPLETDNAKVEKLIGYSNNAPALMRAWSQGEAKVVKARKQEIWSATSFVWNGALTKDIRELTLAPVFRNLHGVLTMAIHVASGGYRKDQIPGLLFSVAYDIAFVRTRFPYGHSDLMHFASGLQNRHGAEEDYNLQVYLSAAKHLKLRREMQKVFDDVPSVLETYGSLPVFRVSEAEWTRRSPPHWYTFRTGAIADFHQ